MTIAIASLADLRSLYQARGAERYDGEPVSHLAHAFQTAELARRAGADDALVAAALLHDVGHLASGWRGTPSADGIDDRHEELGSRLLAGLFPPAVVEPVRLHVEAKRCLAGERGYLAKLSPDSQRSLVLQGGPMSPDERRAFLALPFHRHALRLRCWDDAAKIPTREPVSLQQLWALVEQVAARRPGGRSPERTNADPRTP